MTASVRVRPRPVAVVLFGAVAAVALLVPGAAAAGRAGHVGAQAQGVVVRQDLPYREVNGTDLKLDAYLPDGPGPYPGVVLLYGGGWVSGDKASWEGFGHTLAQSGFAAFAVNYRLAPRDPYPAAVNDVRASVEWIRGHAAELRVDPARIGALGGSAGGHLAALLATLGEGPRDRESRVLTAVSWAGPMDLHPAQFPPDSQPYLTAFLDCRTGPCDEARVQEASPITHVDPSDGTMLLAQGQDDMLIPPDQAQRMSDTPGRAGVANQLLMVPNAGHDERLTSAVVQPSIDFLRSQLFPLVSPSGAVAAPPPPAATVPLPPLPALPPPAPIANKWATATTAATDEAQSPTASRTGSGRDYLPWVGGFVGVLALIAALFAAARR